MVRNFNNNPSFTLDSIGSNKMSNKDLSVEMVSTEVVEFKAETILMAISKGGELDFLTEQLREKVGSFEHDMSTGVSRNRSASLSRKISTAKTKVVKFAKATIEDDEIKIKKVKASLKKLSSDFDELRDEARRPLTEWENEQKIIEAEKAEREAEGKRRAQLENDHEMGLLLNEKIDRDAKEKREIEEAAAKLEQEKAAQEAKELAAKLEADRIERDARIAQEAADRAIANAAIKAIAEAEKVKLDKFNNAHDHAILINNIMLDAARKSANVERLRIQIEEAEKRRVEAAEKANRDALEAAENARLAEVKRQEDQAARVKAEDDAREKDRQHVNSIKAETVAAVMTCMECNINDAVKFVDAVADKQIPNITIKY